LTTAPLTRWQRWLHPEIRESPDHARIARFVGVSASSAFLLVSSQLAYTLARGRYLAAIPGATFLLLSFLCLALLRWRPTPRAAATLLVVIADVLVLFALAGEDGFYGATIAWLGVIAATAILTLSVRAGFVSLGLNAIACVAIELLKYEGLIKPWLFPSIALSALRSVGLIAGFVVLAVLFERARAQAVAEAKALARAKTNFLANVSHELRTPMNGVLGMTDLLLHSKLDGEQRERLQLLQRSGRMLVMLLNDLLDMSKVEAGKMELDPTDFDLGRHLTDLRALHEPVAGARGLTLELVTSGLPPVVRGDALRLRQVLNNLINNALKFTSKGRVTLTVAPSGPDRYRFEVKDTGVGIPAHVLPRLFSPFTQGEAGITRRYGGTGLGLSLCRELVKLMGGDIQLESREGEGTTVSFELPLAAGLGALLTPVPEVTAPPSAGALPVLVVDDNPINLRVACGLVEKAGYRTLIATNGLEAVKAVQAQPVALVLMDCHMPEMDGYEATERIRALDSDVAMVPIIALTASAMPEELERCRKAGMNDCLVKPVSLEQLERTLAQVAALEALMNPS
jgi:signal transduction histidine kinase/ActR/RegA family two-component response regulator